MSAVILSGGHVVGSGSGICAIPLNQGFPFTGTTATGGDQSYGQTTTSGFVSYTVSGPSTAAYNAMQQLGAREIVVSLGGSYEGWQASGRNKQNLVTAIKGQGTYPNLKNTARTPRVFPYAIIESSQNASSGLPYQTFATLVINKDWWVYTTAGGSTPLGSPNSGYYEINYAYQWDATASGTAALDSPIAGTVYGTQSNGQGPAQTGATYFASALLTTNPLDTRFQSLTNGAAPNADGIFWDNQFTFPNGGGNVATTTASWDGVNLQTNSTLAAYPSGASSLISRGQYHVMQTVQSYLASCNPGSTYLNFGNLGNYFNVAGYGTPNSYTASAMANTFHGGLAETVFGTGGSSFQTYQTFAEVLQGYNATMDFCLAPKLVGIGIRLPATDSSQTATWLIGGVSTTVTGATGTAPALEYQCMRAGLCFTLLDNGYAIFIVSENQWSLVRYYDEEGDDFLTQVNVKKGWMGTRVGARPAAAAFSNGIWAAVFTNAIALFNPWANGSQTLSLSQIQAVFPGNYTCISGSQQPTINTGATFVSHTFGDPDGLILLKS